MCVAEERLKAAASIHFRPYNERYRHRNKPGGFVTRPQCAIWMQTAFGAAGVECAPMGMPFYKKWMLPNESGILIPLSFAGCQKHFFDTLGSLLCGGRYPPTLRHVVFVDCTMVVVRVCCGTARTVVPFVCCFVPIYRSGNADRACFVMPCVLCLFRSCVSSSLPV